MPLFECGNQKIPSKRPLWPVFAKDCAVPGGLIVWLFDWWYKMVNDLMGDGTIRLIYGGCTDLCGRMLLSSGSRLLTHHTLIRIIRTPCAVKPWNCEKLGYWQAPIIDAMNMRSDKVLVFWCFVFGLWSVTTATTFKNQIRYCPWPAPKVLAQQVPLAEKLAKASASVSNIIFVVSA